MKNRLGMMKSEMVTGSWMNEHLASMKYDSDNIWYQEINYELLSGSLYLKYDDRKFNDTNKYQVVVMGIIAYLIRNLGKDEKLIFDEFYEHCKNYFKHTEASKAGSSVKDLDSEFYSHHVKEEIVRIDYSQRLASYISKDEMELLNEHANSYLNYIEREHFTKKLTPKLIKEKSELPKALIEIFVDISKYKTIMELLVEKQLIYPITYIWKDKKTGYKGLVCAILKDIEAKGYIKQDVSINWNSSKVLIKNTFNVEIKGNKTFFSAILSKQYVHLIPYSSTLK